MSQSNQNNIIMVPGSAETVDISSTDHNFPQDVVLYVGGTGDLSVITGDGSTVLLQSIPAGSFVPLRVRTIVRTTTTASNIVAMW